MFKSASNGIRFDAEAAKNRLAARRRRLAAKKRLLNQDIMKKETVVDIGSEDSKLGAALSNFEAYSFIFDSVECRSMEGLLQAFKFEDISKQQEVCLLVGKKAKFKGKKRKWYRDGWLYWSGKRYDRFGDDYQDLLDKAFDALSLNPEFQCALMQTGDAILTHTYGKSDPCFTILTSNELCCRLMVIRSRLLKKEVQKAE